MLGSGEMVQELLGAQANLGSALGLLADLALGRLKEPPAQASQSLKRFIAMIDARGRHFGALINAEFGEAFVTKQPPRIDDMIAAYSGREI